VNLAGRAYAYNFDDLFGIHYDPSYVPSNTKGLDLSFSITTTHVTCLSSSGWVAAVDTLTVAGGSPDDAILQASVALSCTGAGTTQWNVQYG